MRHNNRCRLCGQMKSQVDPHKCREEEIFWFPKMPAYAACKFCEESFRQIRSDQIFCTKGCKQRFYRRSHDI